MASKKTNKAPDNRPARARYWANKVLRKRKIRRLMRHCRMNLAQATALWEKTRTSRIKGKVA